MTTSYKSMYDSIIVHYGEIGLKGDNRIFFEKKLVENIKEKLKSKSISIKRMRGRIVIELPKKLIAQTEDRSASSDKFQAISKSLKDIFGIEYFAFAVTTNYKIENIMKKCFSLAKKFPRNTTIKLITKRSDKSFPLTSVELNRKVGMFLESKKIKVDLENPNKFINIEIAEKNVFIYGDTIKGNGGLPVGSSGKVVSLLSGGIDSPVASWMLMKRGCRVYFVHFHRNRASTEVRRASLHSKKIENLCRILSRYQPHTKLYLVPFTGIQDEIIKKVPAKQRLLIYRRFMLRIAEKIAFRENAKAIATGESIGQVASQTLPNISALQCIEMPILRPLIGFNKQEIIDLAKSIETFDESIKPHEDCCSFLISEHPETSAKKSDMDKLEKKLNKIAMIKKALKSAEVVKI